MARTTVIGIGSPHGDDGLGWRVVELISRNDLPGVAAIAVSSPAALLHQAVDVEQWIVVDACLVAGPGGRTHRFEWPIKHALPTRFSGTHDLGVIDALRLAEVIGRLPSRVTLWAGEVSCTECQQELSAEGERLAVELAERILAELNGQPATSLSNTYA